MTAGGTLLVEAVDTAGAREQLRLRKESPHEACRNGQNVCEFMQPCALPLWAAASEQRMNALDIIGVSGNPLEDVRTLQHVTFVMKAGKVVKSGDQKSPQRFDMRSRDGARNQDPAGPRQRRSTRRD